MRCKSCKEDVKKTINGNCEKCDKGVYRPKPKLTAPTSDDKAGVSAAVIISTCIN